ncbi:AraC family transcriptional regulator [Mucilaginibacter sp. cycad4]|uniref:AraC family transcriptional regulator n=1 Tax=Mucilaginibacter sp. cycad4 TaxID=3342096 RepID=UPI002AAAAFD1|nr:AraC family transcriptional regulator [Mucilaginibacter gossypii]WPV02019.1 AraC family transcriptional regulator [Mucilaginibacter gossypii]
MKKIFSELPHPVDSSIIVKQEITTKFVNTFHFHDGFEVTFIIRGQGKFYGGNQLLNFGEGDMYFFGPLFPHYFVNEKYSENVNQMAHSIAVQFQEDFLGKELYEKPEFGKIKDLLKFAQSACLKLTISSNEIQERFVQLTKQQGVKKILLLLELLDYMASLPKKSFNVLTIDAPKTIENAKGFSKLDAVYRYVLENFKQDVNSQKAAGLACLNETAFCRYFKRQTKNTFSQFVNKVRVTHATSLLQDKNRSIANICYECGFNNLSYFNRQFRKFTNKSPFEYRKLYD